MAQSSSQSAPAVADVQTELSLKRTSKKTGRPSVYERKMMAIGGSSMPADRSTSKEEAQVAQTVNQTIKKHSCEVCSKTFRTASSLRSHNRLHSGEKPFSCSVFECKKTFRTQSDKTRHCRIHTGVKTFGCEHCSSFFTTSANLKTHKNVVHFGVKPHTCGTCSKTFGYLTNYRNHLRTHTGEKPYICSHLGCDLRFSEYSIALRHALHQHTSIGSFKCPKCDRIFRSHSGVNYHVKVIHDRIRQELDVPQVASDVGESGLPATSLLRDLILQELPRFASLIRNDSSTHMQSILEEEREAAVLLGFYEEEVGDEMLGSGNADVSGQLLETSFTLTDTPTDWNLESFHSRESLDLFPELASDYE